MTAQAGLRNFNGSVNLVFEVPGALLQSLLAASGSVDQGKNYVFGVGAGGVAESGAKTLSYWSTGDGDDTMVTVWNPADEEQDFTFTLFFSGGHYFLPLHLGPRVTRTFNISEIVHNQIPDAEGNTIPLSVHEGSAQIAGSQGHAEHILVAIDAGIYNVRKATCVRVCQDCSGIVAVAVTPTPFNLSPGATVQETFVGTFQNGSQQDLTRSSSWTTSNGSVGSVSLGLVTANAVGTATIAATYHYVRTSPERCGNEQPPPCPMIYYTGQVPGNVVTATISQRTSAQVSSDDAALNNYNTSHGTTNLGSIISNGTTLDCAIGYETIGAISPNTYTGQVLIHRWFVNAASYPNSTQTGGTPSNPDDTSSASFRDDDPQSGGSAGKVYDLDAPGLISSVDGTAHRLRVNFYTYAALPDGTRVSPNYYFYVRLSCTNTSSGYQFVNDVAGDNQIGPGSTPITWNLQ